MRKWYRWALAGAFLMAVCHAGAAAAQDPVDAEIDALINATQSDAGALALARQQAGSGDLTGAAVTLERSLLERSGPASDEVRLYYGTVLCRLGDQRRGVYQLSSVGNPSASGWVEARAACGDVPVGVTRVRGDGVTGALSLGIGYESDAFSVLTTQFNVPGFPAYTEDGASIMASAAIDARFSSTNAGQGYLAAGLQSRSDISGPNLDYLIGNVGAGYAWNIGNAGRVFSAGLLVRHSTLLGESLVTELGGQAEYSVAHGTQGQWTLKAEAVHQDYLAVAYDPIRDGARFDLAASYVETPGPGRVWTVGAAFEAKDAELEELGYLGARAFAATQFPLGDDGIYFSVSGVIRRADFRDVAATLDLSETRASARAGVGFPLNHQGLSLEAAITYSGRWYDDSSLYDSNSAGAELRLVYRFGH